MHATQNPLDGVVIYIVGGYGILSELRHATVGPLCKKTKVGRAVACNSPWPCFDERFERAQLMDRLQKILNGTSVRTPCTPVQQNSGIPRRLSKIVVNWHDLSARHVWAGYGVLLAAAGIAGTACAPSRWAVAAAIGGLCVATAGSYVEIAEGLRRIMCCGGRLLRRKIPNPPADEK